MDKFRIDNHKLIYHVERVNDWLQGKTIYPIYMEVCPSGTCNHRCTYCGLDFMGYRSKFLDTAMLKERLSEFGSLGLKSIMYAGEGEPFLHQDIVEIVNHTKKCGIDVSFTTNGVFFKKKIADCILDKTAWIKVSINGATKETYSKIHRCKTDDFEKVIKNMTYAAKLKRNNGHTCTLGMQLLLLPENHQEVELLAELARDIGMDYLVIKPYSQHPQSKTRIYSSIKYSDYEYLADKLDKFNTSNFSVIFRNETMKRWDGRIRNNHRCLAFPFWTYVDAEGNVWGCLVFIKDEKFLYGNIYKNSFQEIWEGKKRLESLRWVDEHLDVSKCRVNCRMHEVNNYLWELKNPIPHVNFI